MLQFEYPFFIGDNMKLYINALAFLLAGTMLHEKCIASSPFKSVFDQIDADRKKSSTIKKASATVSSLDNTVTNKQKATTIQTSRVLSGQGINGSHVKELEQTIKRQSEEIEELKKQLGQLRSEISEQENTFRQVNKNFTKEKNELKTMLDEKEEYLKRQTELNENELREKDDQIKQLEEKCKKAEAKLHEQQSEYDYKINGLMAQLEEQARKHQDEDKKLHETINQLKEQLRQREEEKDKIINEKYVELQELRKMYNELSIQITENDQSSSLLRSQLNETTQRMSARSNYTEEYNTLNAQIVSDFEEFFNYLQNTNDNMQIGKIRSDIWHVCKEIFPTQKTSWYTRTILHLGEPLHSNYTVSNDVTGWLRSNHSEQLSQWKTKSISENKYKDGYLKGYRYIIRKIIIDNIINLIDTNEKQVAIEKLDEAINKRVSLY